MLRLAKAAEGVTAPTLRLALAAVAEQGDTGIEEPLERCQAEASKIPVRSEPRSPPRP